MQAAGTLVYLACTARGCQTRTDIDLAEVAMKFGDDFMLWGRRPVCPQCGKLGHYMASPGAGTPFRPMKTGIEAEVRRAAWLKSLGLTKRDTLRIRLMAERVTARWSPPPLSDLDVPYTVAACWPGQEYRSSGRVLGFWANMTLLIWEMNPAERAIWEKRPKGPRSL